MTQQQGPSFLEPVGLDDFFSHYWEKQPLHIARDDNAFAGFIDRASIEDVLASRAVYFPGVQLSQSGNSIEVAEYVDAEDRILPLRLLELHRQGATVVLSQAQKLFGPLNSLCGEALRTLHMRCQTNVYLSPAAKQGFNPHYDTHDVFILQVSGAKTFNFYGSSVELPLPEENFDASKPRGQTADESIRLTAGDTLYIPRGRVHDAVADTDEPSLHITLGVYPLIMRDVLLARVNALATRDKRLRQAVSPALYCSDASSEPLQQELAALLDDLHDPLIQADALHGVVEDYLDDLALDAQQDCTGLLTQPAGELLSGAAIPSSGVLKLQHERVLGHERTVQGVKIRSFGHIVEFTTPVAEVVLTLLQQGFLHSEHWQALQSDQQVAMIERLMQDNLVRWEPSPLSSLG